MVSNCAWVSAASTIGVMSSRAANATITDPFAVLQALAPQVPDDAAELVLARASCDQARATEAGTRPGRHVRWLVAAAAVGVVSTGALLWPGPDGSAFASWTPTPAAATTAQVNAAQVQCDAVLDPRMGDAQDVVRLVDGTSVTAGTLGALNDSSLAQR